MPVTESLMSEMFESAVSTLKGLNHCTEVWLSNLLLDCLINHWPEHWRLPVMNTEAYLRDITHMPSVELEANYQSYGSPAIAHK